MPQGRAIVSPLLLPCLCIPSLISNCLKLPFGTQESSRNRGHRKNFKPRSPIRFYSVSELMEVECYFSKVFLYMDSPWCQLSNSGDKNCYPHLGTVFLGGSSLCVCPAQSCPTLCSPTDCSPPGSSIHGISQAGILGNHCGKWVATSSSRISS